MILILIEEKQVTFAEEHETCVSVSIGQQQCSNRPPNPRYLKMK